MKQTRKTILTALLVGVVGGIIAVKSSHHLSESCQAFREQLKQVVLNDSGLAGLVGAESEARLSDAMEERYGAMTDAQCNSGTTLLAAQQEALEKTAWAPKMRPAYEMAISANQACHDKRVSGELKTHVDSVQCSNPQVTQAFAQAGYPYRDLVAQYTHARLEEAQRLDGSHTEPSEDELLFAKLALAISDEERKRVLQPPR